MKTAVDKVTKRNGRVVNGVFRDDGALFV